MFFVPEAPMKEVAVIKPKLTFIVSKGCPAITKHIPPNPPAMKFLAGLIGGVLVIL